MAYKCIEEEMEMTDEKIKEEEIEVTDECIEDEEKMTDEWIEE